MSEIPEGATHVCKSQFEGCDGYYKFSDGRAYNWQPFFGGWVYTGSSEEYAHCMDQLEPIDTISYSVEHVIGESVSKLLAERNSLIEALEDLLEAEGVLSIAVASRKARLAIARAKGEGK